MSKWNTINRRSLFKRELLSLKTPTQEEEEAALKIII
jgi:hypothetical protein